MKIKMSQLRQLIKEENKKLNETVHAVSVVKGKGLVVRVNRMTANPLELPDKDYNSIAKEIHSQIIPFLDKITKKYNCVVGYSEFSLRKSTIQSGR